MNSKELVRNMTAFLNGRGGESYLGADNASDICREFWC